LSKKSDEEDLRVIASKIAQQVGKDVEKKIGSPHYITSKSSTTDLVTEIDEWSEKTITDYIISLRPNDEVVCEEGTYVSGNNNVRWLIDPIDGTTNFIYGHPGFSISLGIEIDNETKVGALYVPLLDELFAASPAHGTTKNGKIVEVSKTKELNKTLIATGFSYNPKFRETQARNLIGILPNVRDIRRVGGAAFDLASVACGRVDAFFEYGLSPWDVSAGHALVKYAGGEVMTIDQLESNDFEVNVLKCASTISESTITVAASEHLIDQVVELIINSQTSS
tara:strand:- start:2263 stop:3105 length:843 start_codon:yes stop_codon:yes gene_type:complete